MSNRNSTDAVQMAPEQRFAEQKYIAAGQKDCFIVGALIRYSLTCNAPVLFIKISHRNLQHTEGPQAGDLDRLQVVSQITLLHGLPNMSVAHVERMHRGSRVARDTNKDGAIQAPTDEDGELSRKGWQHLDAL
jgi:hypothetical protein